MKKNSNKKTARRIPTKFPCIYKQTGKELYDVRYNYKETDLVTGEVKYKNKWVYGLASLEIARSTLLQLQTGSIGDGDITLAEAFELWLRNAEIRQYKDVSVQNTTGHILQELIY